MKYAALSPRTLPAAIAINVVDDQALRERARAAVARAIAAGCRPPNGWAETADAIAAARFMNVRPRAKVIGLRLPSMVRRQAD